MSKYDELYDAFTKSKQEADDYIKACEQFCRGLVNAFEVYLGCGQDPGFKPTITSDRPQKRSKLAIQLTFNNSARMALEFFVTTKDGVFMVQNERTGEQFEIDPEDEQSIQRFLDSAYVWMKDSAERFGWGEAPV